MMVFFLLGSLEDLVVIKHGAQCWMLIKVSVMHKEIKMADIQSFKCSVRNNCVCYCTCIANGQRIFKLVIPRVGEVTVGQGLSGTANENMR